MSGHDGWLYARGPVHWREAQCPECEETWEVAGHYEHCIWLPERDDDMLCEGCGAEGEA